MRPKELVMQSECSHQMGSQLEINDIINDRMGHASMLSYLLYTRRGHFAFDHIHCAYARM